ncbi:hypothetical protein Tco_1578027 [Tanacetum coccineum]
MDVSHCRLHKTILQVASNYLESDISECLSQQLDLGTKGSIWCKTHMEKTLMSPYDVQKEEHYELFFKVMYLFNLSFTSHNSIKLSFTSYNKILLFHVLLDMFSHSDAVLSALAKHPVLSNQVQEFTLKLLSLTQDSIIRAKSLLEPTSVHLLNSLLIQKNWLQEHKFQIVDWLFMGMNISELIPLDENSMNGIFSLKSGHCMRSTGSLGIGSLGQKRREIKRESNNNGQKKKTKSSANLSLKVVIILVGPRISEELKDQDTI